MGDAKAQCVTELSAAGPGDAAEVPIPSRADRIDYMADLIDELRHMAEHEGLVTLASVLALARTEAEQQAGRDRPR